MIDEIRILAPTGGLGEGFSEESLQTALSYDPHFIGCDAGSTDAGPYYLGTGTQMCSSTAIERDLTLILHAAHSARIPLIIGSAGTAGALPHLSATADLARRIANRDGLRLRLATISADVSSSYLSSALRDQRIKPLWPAGEVTIEQIETSTSIVAQMGAEPFMAALEEGADVIIAGRATDAAIFAALPLKRGAHPGASWHAGQVLECGAGAAARRLYPDCMVATIADESFTTWLPNPEMYCTPQSIAAHTLYENTDANIQIQPSGVLDTSASRYEAVGTDRVRVSGSIFNPKDQYDVRLEGVRPLGYRTITPGGIRDPFILVELEAFIKEVEASVATKVSSSLGVSEDSYAIKYRIYGLNGCLGRHEPIERIASHEVGFNIDVVAETQEQADAISSVAWHTALHHPIQKWSGLISNIAFPYSPPSIAAGPVFEFSLNHVLELFDPCELFPIEIEDL